MKLYYAPGACSLAVHILLEELKIPYELEKVDFRNPEELERFRKINPKSYVPLLRLDNGEFLTEATVIMRYLADQNFSAGLVPTPATFARYRAEEWLNFLSTELHKGFGIFFLGYPEAAKEKATERLHLRLDFLEQNLKGREYLFGGSYSIVDIYLVVILTWLTPIKMDIQQWPNLQKYREKILARPAVAAAMRQEKLIQAA